MNAINTAVQSSVNTVEQLTQLQTQNNVAAQNASANDVDSTLNRLQDTRDAINITGRDGDNSLKSISVDMAKMDVSLSQTELIVYDGALSSANIELQGVRAQLKSKEATLVAEEAKTEIKTSINAEGNAEFITHSGMRIVTDTNQGGHQTWIYNPAGEQIMHIHGDPHVNMLKDADGNNGDDFHFGDDSTLKFEDGTELTFNTTETAKDSGIFYTTGIYVRAGDNVMHTGEETKDNLWANDGVVAERRKDIAKVDVNSYSRMGADEDGAVMMGLKGDGQILMQTGNNQWNELKDESWDGYLEDKTFDDQKGAAVEFKPETIMTGDQISAIKLEITQLESKEAEHQASVAKLTPLKSAAESNLESANADLAKYEGMDDTEFKDDESTRKSIEQKSLDLTRRSNNLGVFMAGSDLVKSGDFAALGVDHGDMINAATDADRTWRMNEIDYNDKGLEFSDVRNDATAQLIAGLANLAEVSDFEEKSVENDQLAPQTFRNNMSDYNDTFNQLMQVAATGNDTQVSTLKEQLEIHENALTENNEPIVMTLDEFLGDDPNADSTNPVIKQSHRGFFTELNSDILVDLENQMSEALTLDTEAGRNSATALRNEINTTKELLGISQDGEEFMAGLSDKVQIDFGDMSEEEAKTYYETSLNSYVDLENQQNEALSLNTEAGRISSAALRTEMGLTGHIVKELERQYGFDKEEVMPERADQADAMLDQNTSQLQDLQAQMSAALAIDTEAGRASAAALRYEIATTQKLVAFWDKSAEFWGSES